MPAPLYTRDQARISVVVKGQAFEGWLQSEVERSLDAISGRFSIPVSLVPGAPPAIQRQDLVEVRIGKTVVMTGYVLSAEPFYRRGDCGMRIVGRDRTGDLVHCSAIHKGGQWLRAGLDRICKDLVAPFGIEVVVDTDIGAPIADFKLSHGETVLEALARAARLRGVMVTRDDFGRLLLTRAGQKLFAGAIRRGQNVISMEGVGSDEHRHSEYLVYAQSAMALRHFHAPGDSPADVMKTFEQTRQVKASAKDLEIKRYTPLIINAEGNRTQAEIDTLVSHTARVRRGHSMGIRYTLEGWTFQGQPWPLNQRVAIFDDIAGLNGETWLICSVRQTCDLKEGDVTQVLVRPVEAYSTDPLKSRVNRGKWKNTGSKQFHGPNDGALN